MYLFNDGEIILGNWLQDQLEGLSILIKDGFEEIFIYNKNKQKKKIEFLEEKETITNSNEYEKLQEFYQNLKKKKFIK